METANLLRSRGFKVETLAFPTYNRGLFAQEVQSYLNGAYGNLNSIPPKLIALLYAGNRLEMKEEIIEKSTASDFLIIDRYVYSNAAHQGVKLNGRNERGEFVRWLEQLEFSIYGLPRADLNILLDITPLASFENVAKKDPRDYTTSSHDLHESNSEYLYDVSRLYHDIAVSGKWPIIRVTEGRKMRPVDDITLEILSYIFDH